MKGLQGHPIFQWILMPSSSGSSKIIYLIYRQQYSKKNDIHYKFRTKLWFTMLTSKLILNLNLNVIEMKYMIKKQSYEQQFLGSKTDNNFKQKTQIKYFILKSSLECLYYKDSRITGEDM